MNDPARPSSDEFGATIPGETHDEHRPQIMVEETPMPHPHQTHIPEPQTEQLTPPFPGNPNVTTVQQAEQLKSPDLPVDHVPKDHNHTAVVKHGSGHRTNPFLFLVPVVLIIGAIVGATLFAGSFVNQNGDAVVPGETPAPSLTPAVETPSPTPLPVITLLEYRDDELLFSFNYPETMTVTEIDNGVELFFVEEQETDDELLPEPQIRITVSDEAGEALPNAVQFQGNEQVYTIELLVDSSRSIYQIIVESFEVVVDTTDWTAFSSPLVGYTINHPPEWIVSGIDQRSDTPSLTIRKSDDLILQTLTILYQTNLSNAELSASEVISSTRNLSGWSGSPEVRLRSFGPANSQVIEGNLNGRHSVFVVVWYRDTLVQMTWNDNSEKTHGAIFEAMLDSFRLL